MKRCIITLVLLELVHAFKFVEVTDDIRLQDGVGQVAAYGDFNADKAIDILQLSENRSRKLEVAYPPCHGAIPFNKHAPPTDDIVRGWGLGGDKPLATVSNPEPNPNLPRG